MPDVLALAGFGAAGLADAAAGVLLVDPQALRAKADTADTARTAILADRRRGTLLAPTTVPGRGVVVVVVDVPSRFSEATVMVLSLL